MKIVNIFGATIATKTLHTGENTLDVSNLVNGVYFVHDANGGAVKFVKE